MSRKALSSAPAMRMPAAGPSGGYKSYSVVDGEFVIFEFASLEDMRSGGVRASKEIYTQTEPAMRTDGSTQTEISTQSEISTQTEFSTLTEAGRQIETGTQWEPQTVPTIRRKKISIPTSVTVRCFGEFFPRMKLERRGVSFSENM